MITDKPKSPIVSRNKKDPTQSYKSLNKTYRNIEDRFYNVKLDLKTLFDQSLKGREREANKQFIFREGVLYQVSANYTYDLTPDELSELINRVQEILDERLLEGGKDDLWIFSTIEDEYRRGTHSAYTNLAHQSAYYAQQTTINILLSSIAYRNQIAQALLLTFSDWRGLTERMKADLTSVLADAIARGINPRETAKIISKRLDISMTRAKSMAQTEQLAAYRNAQWNETKWCNERLGLRTGLLHQSALLPNSRTHHVFWHGKVRTVEEVRNWYAENGNRFNCRCSQLPALLNEDDSLYNESAVKTLAKERDNWYEQRKSEEQ